MVKIIQPGQINEQPPNWWVGKRLTCSLCRCVFQLESGDDVITYAERCIGGRRGVTATCPTPDCGTKVTHQEGGIGAVTIAGAPFFGPIESRRIEPTTMDTAGTVTGPGDREGE